MLSALTGARQESRGPGIEALTLVYGSCLSCAEVFAAHGNHQTELLVLETSRDELMECASGQSSRARSGVFRCSERRPLPERRTITLRFHKGVVWCPHQARRPPTPRLLKIFPTPLHQLADASQKARRLASVSGRA